MRRKPTTVRLSEAERDILRAAAKKVGKPYTVALRERGLDWATGVLSRELGQRPERERGER